MDYIFVLCAVGLSAVFVLGGLGFSYLVAPHRPGRVKNSSYECGEKPLGHARLQFNVGYYLFALMFLIFDVEAAFLYPWAVVLQKVGVVGLIEVVIFIMILILGLLYAWKKGALEWV
jgi:NADH:ubiquinone oxidoreductase subunit 3 (subunit A)